MLRFAFAAIVGLLIAIVPAATSACDAWSEDCSGTAAHSTTRPIVHSARPAGCPRAWCACWLALHKYGRHVRRLWQARAWARVGRPASGPAPGVIVVYARGRGGHVGKITRVIGPGRIVVISGNDGNRVRERERSTRGVIAYRVM